MARYKYALSLTGNDGDFVYLFSAKITAPLNLYLPSVRVQALASGGARYEGAPVNTWYYPSLEAAERTFFRTYCAGLFADDVYIYTLNNNNVWVKARTKMFWMPQEKFESDCSIGFTFTFKVKSATVLT